MNISRSAPPRYTSQTQKQAIVAQKNETPRRSGEIHLQYPEANVVLSATDKPKFVRAQLSAFLAQYYPTATSQSIKQFAASLYNRFGTTESTVSSVLVRPPNAEDLQVPLLIRKVAEEPVLNIYPLKKPSTQRTSPHKTS
jgi:hypothetical protein